MNFGKTKYTILKQIEKNSIHGYKIAKDLDLSLSTVYEHLKYLEEKGVITRELDGQNGKKICSITKKGIELISILEDM